MENPDTGIEVTSNVVCTSPTGIEYSGEEPFEPDRTPALITGIITGVVAATATWFVIRSGSPDQTRPPEGSSPLRDLK